MTEERVMENRLGNIFIGGRFEANMTEAELEALTETELRRAIDKCEPDDPQLELLLGEAERRNLDL